jgi:ribosomal protein L9
MERLSKDDILSIKAGCLKSFGLKDNAACNAARTNVQYVKRTQKQKMTERGIADYKTSVNWNQSIITITAVAL